MSRRRNKKSKKLNKAAKAQVEQKKPATSVFAFGDAEPVLENSLTDYIGILSTENQEYYEPPINLRGLAKLVSANAHHGRAINFKRDCLVKYYKPNDILSYDDFYKWATDYTIFGGAYFQIITNRFGKVLYWKHIPALRMRRMKQSNRYLMLESGGKKTKFKPGEVIYLKNYDPLQDIYGIPDYLGAVQSILLNESATLFRRKYFINNAHMGYVFAINDPEMDEDDEEELKKQILAAKGPGNWNNLFLNMKASGTDVEKSIKIIPVGDAATKDEFERIKNISRNDIISAHGLQPALAGMMPENTGGFGDIQKINAVYFENDVLPRQTQVLSMNRFLDKHQHLEFDKPDFKEAA